MSTPDSTCWDPGPWSLHGVLFCIRNLEVWRAGGLTIGIFCHRLYSEICASLYINYSIHRANLVFAVQMCKSGVLKSHPGSLEPFMQDQDQSEAGEALASGTKFKEVPKKKKSPSVIQINNTLRQCLNIKIYAKKSMMKKIPELEFYTHILVTSRCIRIRIHIPDCFPELQIHISICPRGIAGWSSSRTKSSMAKPRSWFLSPPPKLLSLTFPDLSKWHFKFSSCSGLSFFCYTSHPICHQKCICSTVKIQAGSNPSSHGHHRVSWLDYREGRCVLGWIDV